MRIPRWLFGSLLAATLFSCGDGGDDGSEPLDPGPVDLVLATPNTDDGIILISISGGPVTSAQSQEYELAMSGSMGSVTKLIVRGSLTDGIIGSITVPDRGALASYVVTVDQVAATRATQGTYYHQQSLGGYGVTLVSP